jgi:hypothetical protein
MLAVKRSNKKSLFLLSSKKPALTKPAFYFGSHRNPNRIKGKDHPWTSHEN